MPSEREAVVFGLYIGEKFDAVYAAQRQGLVFRWEVKGCRRESGVIANMEGTRTDVRKGLTR